MNAGRQRSAWLIVAVIALTIASIACISGVLSRLDWAVTDLYSRLLRHDVPSDIVVIGIDERSLAELHQWPWPRSTHARLLERLLSMQPRRVFLDIDFSAPSNAAEDQQLALAMAHAGKSILVLPAFQQISSSDSQEISFTRPLPEFQSSATLGSVNLVPSSDSLIRGIDTIWTASSPVLPAVFNLLSARALPAQQLTLDYALSPSSFDFYSYVDVLEGRVDPAAMHGKTIMVGATAIELGDMQAVPVYRSLPGVVVQALASQTARSGPLRSPARIIAFGLLALWALLVAVSLRNEGWRRNAGVTLLLLTAAIGGSLVARQQHMQIEIVPYLLIVCVSFLCFTLRSLDTQTLRALRLSIIAHRRKALLQSVVESSIECILYVDARGRILSANAAAGSLLATTPAILCELPLSDLLPKLLSGADPLTIEQLGGRTRESHVRALDGTNVPVEFAVMPVPLQDHRLYTVLLRDLRERRAQEQRLYHQATHDALTGLPNRHALSEILKRQLDPARSADTAFALYMLDLTRFKEVNDTLGHNVGDVVLREVAQRFAREVAGSGHLARMGGDEFVILAEGERSREDMRTLAQSLVDVLKTPVRVDGLAIEVGVSIGIACYPDDARDADELLKNADVAMYSAKRRSAPCVFYNTADNAHSIRSLAMLGDLRSALERGSLELHYQPKINLQSGRAESVEALLRWEHPTYGAVSPLEMIPLAESSDLLGPLTDWTIAAALSQARRWESQGLRARIAINLSAHMLQDLSLPSRLRHALAEQDVLPDLLEIEITESAMMLDVERALTIVKSIRDLGVHVAIDDYGTGFSSLRYLRDLSIDCLKLDRSFVADLETNADSRIIVESTLALAKALQLSVVAEGVATAWQVAFLRDQGCDFGQGYFYSKALRADDCAEWMSHNNGETRLAPIRPERMQTDYMGATSTSRPSSSSVRTT